MQGTAYTFFTTENARLSRELINVLREAKAEIPSELEEMGMMGGNGGEATLQFSTLFGAMYSTASVYSF